jgi:hypothetical protein
MANYKELQYSEATKAKHDAEFGKFLERVDYSDFSNFIFHATAYYTVYNNMLQILDTYPINTTATASSNSNLIEKYVLWINQNTPYMKFLVDSFPNKITLTDHDGTVGSYTNIRKDTIGKLIVQTDIDFVNTMLEDATDYDTANSFKAQDLIPQHLLLIDENDVLRKFLHVIGYNFDQVQLSALQLSKQLHTNYTDYNKYAKGSELHVAGLLGFNLIDGQFEKTLAQYLLRDNLAGNLKAVTEQIWNRLLNNLPYIYKTKGTRESIKAILNCFGVSSDMVRIDEFAYTFRPIQQVVNIDSVTSTEYVLGEFTDNSKIKVGAKPDHLLNINKIGLSFNPVDEIDKDILNTLAPIDVGTLVSYPDIYYPHTTKYPLLTALATTYFINKTYDFNTFIRFVEDFDRGLFGTIRQIIPARSVLVNEGITIRSHLLERTRLTDGKLFGYTDIEQKGTVDHPITANEVDVQQKVDVETDFISTATDNLKTSDAEINLIFTATDTQHDVEIDIETTAHSYDYHENVHSTADMTNEEQNNFTSNAYLNESKYTYQNKYVVENRILKYAFSDTLDVRIVGALTNTTLTAASASSDCVVKYTVEGRPFEFTKLRVVVPISSQGSRLMELRKASGFQDYFQSLDCDDTDVSANAKINSFEFYTDVNGEVKLTVTNNFIRAGIVPLLFYDENNLRKSKIDITLSGNQESGVYADANISYTQQV